MTFHYSGSLSWWDSTYHVPHVPQAELGFRFWQGTSRVGLTLGIVPRHGLSGVLASVGWAGDWYVLQSLTASVSVTVSALRQLFLGSSGLPCCSYALLAAPVAPLPVPCPTGALLPSPPGGVLCSLDSRSVVLAGTLPQGASQPSWGPPWALPRCRVAWWWVACCPERYCPVDVVCRERAVPAPLLPHGQSRRLEHT